MKDRGARRRPTSPWPGAPVCPACQAWIVLHGRPPGRPRPVLEALLTAVLAGFAVFAWLHHNDAGAVAAVGVLLVSTAVVWLRWWRGCEACLRLRRRALAAHDLTYLDWDDDD